MSSDDIVQDLLLTPEEYRVFGLTSKEGEELYRWVFERVGYVIGADGRGGSGVFVKTPEGRIALLTARHVVFPCILSGEVQVAASIDGKARFKMPRSVRVSATCDAALVTMPDDFQAPAYLEPDAWDPFHHSDPTPGDHVIAAGMPGLWKAEPDLERRRIDGARTLVLWTVARDGLHQGGLIECKADKRIGGLPSTLRGMSGGPLFTISRRLLGVIRLETISASVDGSLFSTPRCAWVDLFHPWRPDHDVPADLMGVSVGHDLIRDRAGGFEMPLQIQAELYWSPSEPNLKYGGFGRVNAIVFRAGDPARQFPVNVEWIFYFESDHQEHDRMRALREEAPLLLRALSIIADR